MHEQSETIQLPNKRWVNVYGRGTPKAGEKLPGTPDYPTVEDAVGAARKRSEGIGQSMAGETKTVLVEGRRLIVPKDATPDEIDALISMKGAQPGTFPRPSDPFDRVGLPRPTTSEGGVGSGVVKSVLDVLDKPAQMVSRGIENVSEFMGATPWASGVAGEIGHQGAGFALPGKALTGLQKGGQFVASKLPGAQAAGIELGIDKLKAAIQRLIPSTSSSSIRNAALADPFKPVPLFKTFQALDDIVRAESKMSSPDLTLLRVAENLRKKINAGGNKLGLADVQSELEDIGRLTNSLKSQGQSVHPQFSRIFASMADSLKGIPEGAQLRKAARTYRKEQAIDELMDQVNKVMLYKRGTGTQDINANRFLKSLENKDFLRESFDPGELDDVYAIAKKLVEMPALPPPRGVAYGSGLSLAAGGGVTGPLMVMGVDPATAGGVGLMFGSTIELSRRLLPTPTGRKILKSVLESGPINERKVNVLALVARAMGEDQQRAETLKESVERVTGAPMTPRDKVMSRLNPAARQLLEERGGRIGRMEDRP